MKALQIILTSVLILISGCASNQVYLSTSVNDKLVTDKGLVTLSITNNRSKFNTFGQLSLTKLNPLTKKEKTSFSTGRIDYDDGIKTALFSFQLPPGKYKLSEASKTLYPYRYYNSFPNLTFEVKAGSYTDLGRLIVTQYNPSQVLVLRDKKNSSNQRLIQSTYPSYYAKTLLFKKEQNLTWEQPYGQYGELQLSVAKHLTGGIYNPVEHASSLIAGSDLGQVMIRSPQGKWSQIDLKTNNSITAASLVKKGELVVSGEYRTLKHLKSKNNIVDLTTKGIEPGAFIFSRYFENSGFFLAVESKKAINFYRTISLENINWELISSIKKESSFWTSEQHVIKAVKDKIFFASTPRSLLIYDVKSNTFEKEKLPIPPRNISISDNYKIVVFGNGKNFISTDLGKKWLRAKTTDEDGLIYFASNEKAFMLSHGESSGLKVSYDGAKTWTRIGDRTGGPLHLVNDTLLSLDYNTISTVYIFDEEKSKWFWERKVSYQKLMDEMKSINKK